jgi:hypothetical protein
MFDFLPSWSWLSLILLGSFHGLNPAMGWLFAVALGLQERRLRAVLAALGPIVAGHALAIGAVVVAVWLLGGVLPQEAMLLVGGTCMLGFAVYKVVTRFRHPAWVGMRVRGRELVAWSFLMATAHGAGLMLVPALLELRGDRIPAAAAHAGGHAHHVPASESAGDGFAVSVLAVGVHTAAMFVVAGAIAVLVYRKVGVDILRRAWINVDLLWIGALALAGTVTLAFGGWSVAVG